MKPCAPKLQAVNGVITHPDGREECDDTAAGKAEYSRRREAMAERQNWICPISGKFMRHPTFDHEEPRGVGNRDDRILVEGRWHNAALDLYANALKGSRRFHWDENGCYVEVKK